MCFPNDIVGMIFEYLEHPDFIYDEDTATEEEAIAWITNRRAMLLEYQYSLEQKCVEWNINPWSEEEYEFLKQKIYSVDNELTELDNAECILYMESRDICSEFSYVLI